MKKFLFVSSIAVLDGLNENGELDESSILTRKSTILPMQFQTFFRKWKFGASAEGLNTVIVNPGLIIGLERKWNFIHGVGRE